MEIKMMQCPNGHYYNADAHASCPECGKSAGAAPGGMGAFPKTAPPSAPAGNPGPAIGNFVQTAPPSAAVAGGGAAPGGMGAFPKTAPPSSVVGAPGMPNAPMGVTMPVNNPRPAGNASFTPFQVATQPASGMAAAGQMEPVVGWLVCVDGPVRGVDFRIHNGYNYIGREEGDIHIHGDNQISRQKHAVITFVSKRNSFHVGPAEGRNVIEVNDEPVLAPVEMKPYDVLTIGSTKLILVPLCGPNFSWTDGVKND